MKFRRIMQLWIIGIIILFSAQSYALEEKITISPSPESEYLFDITVSGKTDSGTVTVAHSTFIDQAARGCPTTSECDYPMCDGRDHTIKLYVAINKCVTYSPVPHDYSFTFKWYSDRMYPNISAIEFYLRENSSDSGYTDYGSYKLVATQSIPYILLTYQLWRTPTEISIGKATFEVRGADKFTSHNISLPGYEGLYWGTFQWDPYLLSWKLKDAGAEK